MSRLLLTAAFVVSLWSPVHASDETVGELVDSLTYEQTYLLKKAYEVGKLLDLPETVQAVLLQETLAGKHGRVNWGEKKVAFGVTQIKPSTAAEVIEKKLEVFESMSVDGDGEIMAGYTVDDLLEIKDHKNELLNNDLAAIVIAAVIIHDNMRRTGSWRRAVVAYYEGVVGSTRFDDKAIAEHFYFKGIAHNLKVARAFNKLQGLH